MRPFLPLIFLVALSGCANHVKQLRDLNPAANDFPSSLASEYQDYASSEYEQGRLFSAEHFAGKGLKALKGEQVEPEQVDGSLPEADRNVLSESRTQLVKFRNEDMERVSPQKLAHAQLLFDCWQNELRKRLNQAKAPCAEEFHSTMAELQEVSDAIVFDKEASHSVLFSRKSTNLDKQGMAVIKSVAERVAGLPHYRVMLLAYTGRAAHQRHMTEERIAKVRRALVKAGVSEKHIAVKKEGGAKAVLISSDHGGDHIEKNTKKITIIVKTQEAEEQ